MPSDDKKFGCVLGYGHKGECYVGTRGVDCHTQQLEDEIARLRAENEQLRASLAAKTLRAETVCKVRAMFRMEANHFSQDDEGWDESEAAFADLSRAYPEEE